jgi:hypothetical protein
LISCVFPGFDEVFANSLTPVSILIREDFPTFDLPIKAYSGIRGGGHLSSVILLITNRTDLMIIEYYTAFIC